MKSIYTFKIKYLLVYGLFCLTIISGPNLQAKDPSIFPYPKSMEVKGGEFVFNKRTELVEPASENSEERFIARMLFNELVDTYDYSLNPVEGSPSRSGINRVLIGTLSNAEIKNVCDKNGWTEKLRNIGDEGYIVDVDDQRIIVASNTIAGSIYGIQSLIQIINENNGTLTCPKVFIEDQPRYPFRGIKLYLPSKEEYEYFKKFIKEFVLYYKYNKIILELNANMRLDRHPELNIGTRTFTRELNDARLNRPPGPHNEYQNSSHHDNANGEIWEKDEIKHLVSYVEQFNIEVIPELPSLTHSYYLLRGHENLAENPNQKYPDTYCPLLPEAYDLYFDVLDEYIEVINPSTIHVGHDEWRMEKDVCERCRGKDYGKLFADDINKIHSYLASKNIRMAIWGDHLLESVRQKDFRVWETSTGYKYKIPGALKPEQVANQIPKDILIFNWFWDDIENDRQISSFGFDQVYGNLRPEINQWEERNEISGVLGGAPSSWAATTELNLGKDQMYDFITGSNLLWSEKILSQKELAFITASGTDKISVRLSGEIPPSMFSDQCLPLDISSHYNLSKANDLDDLKNQHLKSKIDSEDGKLFKLGLNGNGNPEACVVGNFNGLSFGVEGIKLSKDVNSIIFLHGSNSSSINEKAYGTIYNFDETATLLGWYEIIYEDGYIETIPIRYGVNILDWKWKERILKDQQSDIKYNQDKYAYYASGIECSEKASDPATFFSFEWKNPRYGEKIQSINLKSVKASEDNQNAILLMAISVVSSDSVPNSIGVE
ncbi:MAG: glycoside hydrolase family 20 zincin-like fold domain-containing protein [Bacteroidota bacterium]